MLLQLSVTRFRGVRSSVAFEDESGQFVSLPDAILVRRPHGRLP